MSKLFKIQKIQTRLALLGAVTFSCLLFFAGWVVTNAFQSFRALKNFQQTTKISIVASDLAKALTVERQSAYNAAGFLGEGTPQEQIAVYRDKVQATQARLKELDALAQANNASFSDRFRDGLKKAIESDSRLNELRNEILDTTNRPLVRDESSKLKSKALTTYDGVLFTHASFLPLLCTETDDGELSRRIMTLDNVARLQRNLFKVKGLVGTGLRMRKTNDSTAAEIKLTLIMMEDHIARIRTLSSPAVVQMIDKLLASQDYTQVTGLAQKVRDALNHADDYKELMGFPEYQGGMSMRIEKMYEELVAVANDQISEYTRQRLAQERLSFIILGTCSVASVLFIGALIVAIARSITRPLRSVSKDLDDTASGATQSAEVISSSAGQLSNDASEQAAALEEISASMEELSGMTSNNLTQMQKMSECAEQAIRSTQQGSANVAQLTEAMNGMKKSTSDVASIIKVIDEIAFQTNILALNAAVEAARAGEAGAGFAVVADEVRSLAQRSAQASRETAEKIAQAVRSSTQGSDLSQITERTFAEISKITSQYHQIVREVQAASKESAEGLSQVKSAVLTVDQITQRTAAAAEENASASAEMKAMVDRLLASVQQLEAMVITQRDEARRTAK